MNFTTIEAKVAVFALLFALAAIHHPIGCAVGVLVGYSANTYWLLLPQDEFPAMELEVLLATSVNAVLVGYGLL